MTVRARAREGAVMTARGVVGRDGRRGGARGRPRGRTRARAVDVPDFLVQKLEATTKTHGEISERMADPNVTSDPKEFQKLSKALGELTSVVEQYERYKACAREIDEAKAMVRDAAGDDEMVAMAKEEMEALAEESEALVESMTLALLPKDPLDEKNIMLEIRAGTGGDEAGIWAGDLYRMYIRFAEREGWQTSMVTNNPADMGGYKEVVIEIKERRVQ